MFKWSGLSHRPGAHTESTRSALHVDDRMVAVFPRGCCRQTNNVLSLHSLHNLLKVNAEMHSYTRSTGSTWSDRRIRTSPPCTDQYW